jgi:hypothetical protein
MLWNTLILLSLSVVAHSELILIESDILIGHRFHARGMFKGEFECLNKTLHGRRKFFEFALTICNDGERRFHLREEDRILEASLQYLNGTTIPNTVTNITLPFLRDSVCRSRIFFTRGNRYTIGPDCCCKYVLGIPCMWVDITNLTLPEGFEFQLSLSNFEPLTVHLRSSELEREFQDTDNNRVNGFVFVLAAAALVVVLLPYGRSKFRVA